MKKAEVIISIVLFTMAGLFILYSIWAFTHCQSYIADAISSGQLVKNGNEYDIVKFYMSNCAQYTVYAMVLFALGWLLHRRPVVVIKTNSGDFVQTTISQKDDKELDEWFEELQQEKEV